MSTIIKQTIKSLKFEKLWKILKEKRLYITVGKRDFKVTGMCRESSPIQNYVHTFFWVQRTDDLVKNYRSVEIIRVWYGKKANYFHVLVDNNDMMCQWPLRYRKMREEYNYTFKDSTTKKKQAQDFVVKKMDHITKLFRDWYINSLTDDVGVLINVDAKSLNEAVFPMHTSLVKSLAVRFDINLND